MCRFEKREERNTKMTTTNEDTSKILVGVLQHLTEVLTTAKGRRAELMRRQLNEAIWTAKVALALARIVAGEELEGIDVDKAINAWREQDLDDAS